MRIFKYIGFACIAISLLLGCNGKDSGRDENAFDFRVVANNITEGDDVPVTVSLINGPKDSYIINAEVFLLDLVTNKYTLTPYKTYYGERAVDGLSYDFIYAPKLDLTVPDVKAGTYKIEVSMKRGEHMQKSSAVVVVSKGSGGGGEDPIDPPEDEDIPVESFDITGLTFTEGKIVLKEGNEVTGMLMWTPSNATLTDFFVKSSNEAIVEASLADRVFSVKGKDAGSAIVTVWVDGGPSREFPVEVMPNIPPVETISVEGLDSGGLQAEAGSESRFNLSWSPVDAVPEIHVSSSNETVVDVFVEGTSTLVVRSLYPGDAVVTVAATDGVSTSFSVRVVKTVNVVVEWEEPQATDVQLRTKTFPCQLKISSDADLMFPSPVKWTLTLKGVVTSPGKDAKSYILKTEVSFDGKHVMYYDVSTNFLIECYLIYRTENFGLSIAMEWQLNNPLNSEYWKLNIDDKFKTQDVKINQYITSIQQ